MLSLSHLPPPPSSDKITACETDGCLRAMQYSAAYTMARQLLGDQNVDIALAAEVARPAQSKHEAKEAFCAHTETPWQKVLSVYHEEGLESAIREYFIMTDVNNTFKKSIASVALKILASANKIQNYLPIQITSQNYSYSSSNLNLDKKGWSNGGSNIVMSLDWHPHTCTVAVTSSDDIIRVFGSGRTLSPILKHRAQKNICKLEWMPNSASILAVACEGGVLVWTLDPTSVVTRPSGSCLSQLAHPCTTPTTSISWHPKGTKLACVGTQGRSIVVWDVGLESCTVVHTSFAGGIKEVLWSPDGSRLLAATTSNVIKVFETENWTYERWTLESPLQSAVWSKSGNLLLFVTLREPAMFCLKFSSEGTAVGGAQVASQVADFTQIAMTTEEGEELSVGGCVNQLSWDPLCERLAVVFRNSDYIAVLHTRSDPQLHLAPGGFIRGEFENMAISCHFQKNINSGAVLSIVWSHSPVQHIPLRFTSMNQNSSIFNTSIQPNQTLLNYSVNMTNLSMAHQEASFSLGAMSPMSYPLSRLFTSP